MHLLKFYHSVVINIYISPFITLLHVVHQQLLQLQCYNHHLYLQKNPSFMHGM